MVREPTSPSVPAGTRWLFVFVCLGDSPRNIPSFPLWDERVVEIPPIGPKTMNTSGPRVIENFLDIAHFPYVHTNYLGIASNSDVRDYEVVFTPVPGLRTGVTLCTDSGSIIPTRRVSGSVRPTRTAGTRLDSH